MDERVRIRWRRIDLPGTDEAVLNRAGDGWSLSGVATLTHSGRVCRLEYAVLCDSDWRTNRCTVSGTVGDSQIALDVTRDDGGHWTRNGRLLAAIDGCEDIDLAFTPATNVLPIRRLRLAAGERAHVRAAWVRFPQFDIEVLEQDYTRLGEDRYLYESAGGTFRRELTVDGDGLVLDYPGLWTAEHSD